MSEEAQITVWGAPLGWLNSGPLPGCASLSVFVFSCITNHPRVLWLKTLLIHNLPQFCGWISGRAWLLVLLTHVDLDGVTPSAASS